MDKLVHRQNLENFRKQLAEATDETKRLMLAKLVAEEKAKEVEERSGE